jgi:hypothetical protein
VTIWEYSGTSRNKSVVTGYWFQEASCVLHSNACWPVVTEGVTMFLKYLLDIPLTPASQRLGKINPSRDIGNGRKRSDKTLSPYAKRLRLFALVLAVACIGAKLYRPNGERIDRCTSSLQTLHRKNMSLCMELCALRSGYNYRQAIIKKIALIEGREASAGASFLNQISRRRRSYLFCAGNTSLQTSLFASATDRRLILWQITLPM